MVKKRLRTIVIEVPPTPVTIRQKFEAWVASWYPGFKTKITTALGGLGALAASVQGYFSGLPLDQFITAKQIAIASAVLFTMSYWFKSLGERYQVPPEAGS